MRSWIESVFGVETTTEDGVERDVFRFGSTVAGLDSFLGRFGGVDAPPTLATLKASDPEDVSGWHQHFDAWKDAGIID